MGKLSITYENISELKPYAGNARTHSRKQIKQIAAAIAKFGFTNPVLIDEDGEIIAGHGRVKAAEHLGLSKSRQSRLAISIGRKNGLLDWQTIGSPRTPVGTWKSSLTNSRPCRPTALRWF
jgi:hypothetical protein